MKNHMNIYFWRAAICFLGCAGLLRLAYGEPTILDQHVLADYAVTCGILTGFALLAWALSLRKSLAREALSSAAIAFALSAVAIYATARFGFVTGMPWHYFYKDNAVATFRFAAPGILATLTGLLCLLREHTV